MVTQEPFTKLFTKSEGEGLTQEHVVVHIPDPTDANRCPQRVLPKQKQEKKDKQPKHRIIVLVTSEFGLYSTGPTEFIILATIFSNHLII